MYYSDMVSFTAGLSHDPTVILMTPLPHQCTPDVELLSATLGPIPHSHNSHFSHTVDNSNMVQYIIYTTTKDKLT